MESILSGHDEERNNPSMDFDTLFDTKALRIMRVLIPFFPASYQPLLAVWIRFAELRYALSILKGGRFTCTKTNASVPNEDLFAHLLSALKPCLSESEYQELIRMQNMFAMYQRFQQMTPYLSALSGMSGGQSPEDMMNLFHAMQGDENTSASDMMHAFSAMQGGGTAPDTEAQNEAPQNEGSSMDLDSILNLISLFQSVSNTATTGKDTPNTSERQDEPEHEQGLDER